MMTDSRTHQQHCPWRLCWLGNEPLKQTISIVCYHVQVHTHTRLTLAILMTLCSLAESSYVSVRADDDAVSYETPPVE